MVLRWGVHPATPGMLHLPCWCLLKPPWPLPTDMEPQSPQVQNLVERPRRNPASTVLRAHSLKAGNGMVSQVQPRGLPGVCPCPCQSP